MCLLEVRERRTGGIGRRYQFLCLFHGTLRTADGGLALLAGELIDLVEFLCKVCFDEFEFSFVVVKLLRAGVGVEGV